MHPNVVIRIMACIAIAGLAGGSELKRGDGLVDDFDHEVEGRWTTVKGNAWKLADGEFFSAASSGTWGKSMTVCDFPIVNGVVEAELRSLPRRESSVGIVGKYIDNERCWYIRCAYWVVSVMVPGQEDQVLGPFSLFDSDTHETRGSVRLKLDIRGGRVGLYVNGIMRAMFKDPLAGEAGRPGLYTESTSYADYFIVRKAP